MPLSALVLLYVINQNLQPAIHAAVVEVESKPSNLDGLAASLMLSSIDACGQSVEYLVISIEQGVLVNGAITALDFRRHPGGSNDDGFFDRRDGIRNPNHESLRGLAGNEGEFLRYDVLAVDA